MKEFFPSKATVTAVSRPAKKDKFKVSYLASSEKLFSEYFLMVAPERYC